MIKRLTVIFCFFVIVLFAGLVAVVHSSWATSRVASFFIMRSLRDASLNELTISRQRFVFPGQLTLADVKLSLTINKEEYALNFKELAIENLQEVLAPSVSIPVRVKGMSVDHKNIKIPEGNLVGAMILRSLKFVSWQGMLAIPEMEAYRYKVTNILSKVAGSAKDVSFKDLNADFYGGDIAGQVDVSWTDGVRYRSDLQFDGVDLSALKKVDDSIHAQIEGVIGGTMTLGGSSRNFDTLGLKVQITKNGRMNASLLKFVLPYIPRTEDSVKLLEIMKVPGSKVPVEIARMDLRTVDEHKISGEVKLGVGRLNLELNLPIDIIYDGNLFSLIEWMRKFGK